MHFLHKVFLGLLALATFISCNSGENQEQSKSLDEASDNYVGEKACIQCHQQEYKDWTGSHHDWAMKHPTVATVKGDFNDVSYTANDESYFFYKKDTSYYVKYMFGEREPVDYQVVYTFGITPLQQYLIKFPDGKIQTLRASWDVEKKQWFSQYEGQQIPPNDWLHWSQGGQRWNTMCAECHSTNLHKNYDAEHDRFSTTYSLINVSCEACHGPGKAHVEWASGNKSSKDVYSTALVGKTQHDQLNMCAGCHASRVKLTNVMESGMPFDDQFMVQAIDSQFYYTDGQIKDEDYVYGSFLQSKMYHNNVKCSDCHNVHSLELKQKGNALCMQCHEPKYNLPSHHFHEEGTEAAQCINCHMTGRTYMGNDFRRDHSFRVPRPDQSVNYGTPNACTGCHKNKSDKWAANWVVKWYGTKRPNHFSDYLLLAGAPPYSEEAKGEVLQFINNLNYPSIARATALEYYPLFSTKQELEVLIKAFIDSSGLVRYHALNRLLEFSVDQRIDIALHAVNDSTKLVRTEAAWLIVEVDPANLPQEYQGSLQRANAELKEMLHANADFPLGRLRLGDYHARKNNWTAAIKEYKMALKMDSLLTPVYGNLATAYNLTGNNEAALSTLGSLIGNAPEQAHGYYLRGILYAEMGNNEMAISDLKKATGLAPERFRAFYNLANLYYRTGQLPPAKKAIESALQLQPNSEEAKQLLQLIQSK